MLRHSLTISPIPLHRAAAVMISVAGAAMLLAGSAIADDAATGAARARELVEHGRLTDGIVACVACHRDSGQGDAESAFGNLTGLTETYIAKQLADYRSGIRENRVMQVIAAKLTDADIAALAGYYSKLEASDAKSPLPAPPAIGVTLAEQGDAAREIPSCVTCHNVAALAGSDTIPNIAGQHALYISRQLEAWQTGARNNDPGSIMSSIAKKLTADEINAVALYFARQKRKAP